MLSLGADTSIGGEGAVHERCARTLQLFAKILHNGSESGSVTLANQIHFSSSVQLAIALALVSHAYVRLI